MYLSAAMQGGASVRMVRDWRINGNMQDAELAAMQNGEPIPVRTPAYTPPSNEIRCSLCGSSEDAHELQIIYVHRSCERVAQRSVAPEQESAAETV
jgi:hypothetical protein